MPKKKTKRVKKRTVSEEFIEPEDSEEGEVVADDRELPPEIAEVLEKLGEDALYVHLSSVDDQGKESYLGKMPVADFDLETIKIGYGGGRYRVRFKGAENKYLPGGTTFQIDPRFKKRLPPVENDVAVVSGQVDPTVMLLMKMLMDQRSAPQKDPMEVAAALGAVAAEQAKTSMTMLMGVMTPLLTALMSRSDAESVGPNKIVDLIKIGLSLADERSSGEGGYGDVIKAFGPLLSNLATKAKGEAVEEPKQVTDGEPDQRIDADAPGWVSLIAQWIPRLIDWAKQDKDTDLYAGVVIDNLPDQGLELLTTVLLEPGFPPAFYNNFPRALPYKYWFDGFIDSLRATVRPEPEPPEIIDEEVTEVTE